MSVKTYAQNLVAASRWKPPMHSFVVRTDLRSKIEIDSGHSVAFFF